MRPFFLEFPKSTWGGKPLDLDAGNEFLLGRSLLIAPPPYPEGVDEYRVLIPPAHWYDYWAGGLVDQAYDPLSQSAVNASHFIPELPRLDTLPVFVREGTILPIQPLTQSTSDLPQGPLTLRVYPGRDCQGSLYQDDGTTMEYQRGQYLRMQFSCQQTANSVKLHIGAHEGSYQPWWKQLRIEVYGWRGDSPYALLKSGVGTAATLDSSHHMVSIVILDDGHGTDLELTPHP